MLISFKNMFLGAFIAATACYLGIIFWAEGYTHLAQQRPEESINWLFWYAIGALPLAFLSALAAFSLARWTMKRGA